MWIALFSIAALLAMGLSVAAFVAGRDSHREKAELRRNSDLRDAVSESGVKLPV